MTISERGGDEVFLWQHGQLADPLACSCFVLHGRSLESDGVNALARIVRALQEPARRRRRRVQEYNQGDAIVSGTLQDRFSFWAFGPYGPVYIQFGWRGSNARQSDEQANPDEARLNLSANGWPVQRITKGKYRVMEPNECVEVVSDHPCAP